MKRSQVDDKYKWKLTDIFASDEEWEKAFAEASKETKRVGTFKRNLHKREGLLECLKYLDEIEGKLMLLYIYAHLKHDEDSRETVYAGMYNRMMSLFTKFSSDCAFIKSGMSALDDAFLLELAADPEFKDYDFKLKETARMKKHVLPEREEKLLANASGVIHGITAAYRMLEGVDRPVPMVTFDGQRQKLTHGLYSYQLSNGSRDSRKRAFKANYKSFESVINVMAALMSANVKSGNFYADARGHGDCLEMALYGDDVPVSVYKNLVNAVEGNLATMHDYMAFRKQMLGYDKLHMYDMHVPLVPEINMTLEYEEAYNTVIEGLAPMGSDYGNMLREARDKGWIDVMENEGKRTGAYSFGTYGCHPYVMLNYSRTFNDMFTVAHELGHAMHSYYSNQNQPQAKHSYEIFAAEVASTVNEVLLLKHMIKTSKDEKAKAYMLNYYLDMFRTTMFRQTMFAQFEKLTHDTDRKGQPLTVESLNDKYYKLNKKYYGKAVYHDREIRFEWARIPHFYNAFYVYKYATGLTAAVNIAKRILTEPGYAATYQNKFLSAGGKDSPFNILKDAGVDLSSPEPFNTAMGEFRETLEELKKLMAKA